MPSFRATRIESVEWKPVLQYDIPLAIDDMSLAHHLGIRNRVLWWMVHDNKKMYEALRIPKRGSSGARRFRDLYNPLPRMKSVQKVLLARFLEPIPLGKHVGAYVPGRSCRHTAAQHVNKAVIISLDLRDFFTSVRRSMIRRVLHKIGYNHEVSSLLAQLMCYTNFVPQGAPTSGYIANLVADRRFDRRIIRYLHELDPAWTYTRYSDDIDISHPQEQSAETLHRIVARVDDIVRGVGFRLNQRKTKLEPRQWRQRVLGMVVNDKVNVPRYEYMRVRSLIHNCLMHGFESQYKRAGMRSADALRAHIRGKLNFFSQVNEEKAERLFEKYHRACEVHEEEEVRRVQF